jgi:hypothetical protein
MKRLLVMTLAAVAALNPAQATSQVPHVVIYFDGNPVTNTFNTTEESCKSPGTLQDLYVVFRNWNMYVVGAEFSIDYPPALFFLGDIAPISTLTIGSSNSRGGDGGIAIAWQYPQNAFEPLLAITAQTIWTGSCWCRDAPQPLRLRGYWYAHVGNGGNANPRAVRWPDFVEVEGIGLTSLVCPGQPATAATTWGRIKAMYR